MTGAPLPRGCDTVIPYEVIEIQNNKAFILNAKEVHIGQNIHLKGSDYKKNTLLLSKNSIIQPRHISILASSGIKTVQVKTNPKIAIISIGDELIDPGLDLLPHQIFRSNPFALRALCAVHHLPVETLAHLPDVQDRMLAELKIIFSQHEIIILSGAVSKGKFDFLPAVLHELGVKKIFHQVRQRPGKPLYFGCGRENQLVFGLPGNPVSSVVNLRKYVINALKNIDSPTMYVHLTESINVTNDMTFFIPAKLEYTRDGLVIARPIQGNGSGDFYSLKESDGFIEVDNLSGSNNFSAGSVLPFYHWNY
jgi:molybdopterin molybdotransferase